MRVFSFLLILTFSLVAHAQESQLFYNEETGEYEDLYIGEGDETTGVDYRDHGDYGPSEKKDPFSAAKRQTDCSSEYEMAAFGGDCSAPSEDEGQDEAVQRRNGSQSECRANNYQIPNVDCSLVYENDRQSMIDDANRQMSDCSDAGSAARNACALQESPDRQGSSKEGVSGSTAACQTRKFMNSQKIKSERQLSACRSRINECRNACNIVIRPVSNDPRLVSLANQLTENHFEGMCGEYQNTNLPTIQRSVDRAKESTDAAEKLCKGIKNDDKSSGGTGTTTTSVAKTNDSGQSEGDGKTEDEKKEGELAKGGENNSPEEGGGGAGGLGDILSGLGEGEDPTTEPDDLSENFNPIASTFQGGKSKASGVGYTSNKNPLNLGADAVSGDAYQGTPDDPRSRGRAPSSISPANLNGNHFSNGPNGAPANFASGSSPSRRGSSGSQAGTGRSAVEGRNRIHGYKNIKPTGGASSVSIKPKDLKRFGYGKVQEKLNAARRKHGRKVPLIFKGDKFVKDFLAMKEAERGRTGNVALDGRSLKYAEEHKCIKLSQCHLDAKSNIFWLLNLRMRKSLHAVDVD